ncbi:hypothetical protein ACSNOI_13845 [Actinomadura kijaniata]
MMWRFWAWASQGVFDDLMHLMIAQAAACDDVDLDLASKPHL